jgi:hypothetical protein
MRLPLASLLALALLAGCAGPNTDAAPASDDGTSTGEPTSQRWYLVVDLVTEPAPLTPVAAESAKLYMIDRSLRLWPQGGRGRSIRAGTIWAEHGTIAQGTVYRPVNGPLRIAALKAIDAYLVVRDRRAVGFWLPGQQAFNPAQAPARIALTPWDEKRLGAKAGLDRQ